MTTRSPSMTRILAAPFGEFQPLSYQMEDGRCSISSHPIAIGSKRWSDVLIFCFLKVFQVSLLRARSLFSLLNVAIPLRGRGIGGLS